VVLSRGTALQEILRTVLPNRTVPTNIAGIDVVRRRCLFETLLLSGGRR
jgi:hypothetical protein